MQEAVYGEDPKQKITYPETRLSIQDFLTDRESVSNQINSMYGRQVPGLEALRRYINEVEKRSYDYMYRQYAISKKNLITSKLTPSKQIEHLGKIQEQYQIAMTKVGNELKRQRDEINRIDSALNITSALSSAQTDVTGLSKKKAENAAELIKILPQLDTNMNSEWAKLEKILTDERENIKKKYI